MPVDTFYYVLPQMSIQNGSQLRVSDLKDLATRTTCLISSGGEISMNSVALESNASRSYCIRDVGNQRVLAGGHVDLGEQRRILSTIGNGTVQGKVIPIIICLEVGDDLDVTGGHKRGAVISDGSGFCQIDAPKACCDMRGIEGTQASRSRKGNQHLHTGQVGEHDIGKVSIRSVSRNLKAINTNGRGCILGRQHIST